MNDYLMSRCGSNDSNTNLSFRQVLTYQGGVSSKDDDLDQEAIEHLKEILLPAALKVFGEEDNEEAKKVWFSMFSYKLWINGFYRHPPCFQSTPTFLFLDTISSFILMFLNLLDWTGYKIILLSHKLKLFKLKIPGPPVPAGC